MLIAIPDDYHGLVPTLDCYGLLEGHEVRVLREAAPPFETLVRYLRDAEVIVPIRERTRFTRELITELPRLRMISQTGRSTHHVDVAACTERGIVTADHLAAMKRDALIVNTARAELIETGALERALAEGRPGQAAVDVYENEPVLHGDHPLLAQPHALCTAHSAWLEKNTYELYFREAFENVRAYAAGKPLKLVNPEVRNRR